MLNIGIFNARVSQLVDVDALLVLQGAMTVASAAYQVCHASVVACHAQRRNDPCVDCSAQEESERDAKAIVDDVQWRIDVMVERVVEWENYIQELRNEIESLKRDIRDLEATPCTFP